MAFTALKPFKLLRTFRLFNVSNMCSYPKENLFNKELNVRNVKKVPDVLLQNLTQANTFDETMNIVDKHSQVFNKTHILRVSKTLFELTKTDPQLRSNILQHRTFDQFLFAIKKHCRTMDSFEIIEILKILTYFEVPGNSAIFQVLLQLIRQDINRLELKQVMFLDFVLQKSEKTYLSESLKLALPLVFQLQLEEQMDHENIPHLADLLKYACHHNIPEKHINNILTCLLLQNDNIDINYIPSIMWSMCTIRHMNNSKQFEKLFPILSNRLASKIDELSYEKIISLINVLRDSIIETDFFYNEKLFNAFSNYIIKNNLGFEKGIQIALISSRIAHCNLELLDYLANSALSNTKHLSTYFNLVSLIKCCSIANYKPNSWELLKPQIFYNTENMLRNPKHLWIKVVFYMMTLDIYIPALLEKIFSDGFLDDYLVHQPHKTSWIRVFQLYLGVKTFAPSLSNFTIPPYILNNCININCGTPIDETLKQTLELALGGEQYCACNVQLPNGVFVDCVIGYRDGNYPVALMKSQEKNFTKFEDLDIQSCKHVICIMGFRKGNYSRNVPRLLGHSNFVLNLLEHSGYNVLPIPLPSWLKLASGEQIPFLMREINYKLSEITQIDQKIK